MTYLPHNPLIAQSDHTLLLETASPRFAEARDALLAFAELVKSPEYIHTWRITALSLWNAAAAGKTPGEVVETLRALAKYPVPAALEEAIYDKMGRFGRLRLVRDGAWLRLEGEDEADVEAVRQLPDAADLFTADPRSRNTLRVHPRARGEVKQVLTALGHPVQDLAGYDDGDALTMRLAPDLPDGSAWSLRDYQIEAIDAFHGGPSAGSGVVVLPCGAGKTLVGIGAMVRLGMRTLILCTGHTALEQWRREILERTTLTEAEVGSYTSQHKRLAPVTLTTYQLLTWRRSKDADPKHFQLFHEANWGLVIYDEVHLLPAPIFRASAWLQARRRLGLTATLVREDGNEGDVFSLIGPKRFDMPWKRLEHQGWIAPARCVEVRVPMAPDARLRMVRAGARDSYRLAATSPRKGAAVQMLLKRHEGEPTLLLGTYVDHLAFLARRFGIPMISGKTPRDERDALYARFRSGELRALALSKVGNFSVDLPDASVAIQVSGSWGSRQEEAQRLGRVLRRKPDGRPAWFYTLVTPDSPEQACADHRQLFLTEQGYPYRIETFADAT